MSHGSEVPGRKQKYQEWMSKGVRTKKEMSAYQKGAGKNWKMATNQRSRKSRVTPAPSLITQESGHPPQLKIEQIMSKLGSSNSGRSKPSSKAKRIEQMPMMEMPMITNLRRERR
jgi:hypothetical protein